MADTQETLNSALEAYSRYIDGRRQSWIVASNPILNLDEAEDLALQKRRQDGVRRALGPNSELSDYIHLSHERPKDPVERMQHHFKHYLSALRDDVTDCLSDDQLVRFEDIVIGLLPTGLTNAEALRQSITGDRLPGGIIAINEGLYFAVKMISEAIVLEDLQGDFAAHQKNADHIIAHAVDFYLSPSPDKIATFDIDFEDPEFEGQLATMASSVSSVIMRFVALHEFAHLELNHHDRVHAARLSVLAAADEPDSTLERTTDFLAMEYEADRFAFQGLMRRAPSVEAAWGNLYAICLFFRYLACIETRIGNPISQYHPPPRERADALVSFVTTRVGNEVEFRAYFEKLDTTAKRWERYRKPERQ